MNEEMLKALYDKLDLQSKTDFETFKADITDNPAMQEAIYNKLDLKSSGVQLNTFKTDLGVSTLSNNQRNLLDTVADKESTGYDVIVGGGKFDDYSQHPNVVGMVTAFGPSTAAGKYQITKSTWDKVSKKLGLTDFSPESQDQAALYLAQERFKGKTGKDLDTALESDNPNDIEEIKNVLGGSGNDTLWQGLQGDKDFTRRYNERRGLVDAQGSASDPIGPIGVTFDEGVDQSKFDQETLTNMYVQAGGDPSKEKFTTKVHKIQGTGGYRLDFEDSKGVKNYNYAPDNLNIFDRVGVAGTNGLLALGWGVSSTIGAVVGLVEDAAELVTKGDTNFDKTFDYADNSVMDYLNNSKIHSEKTQGFLNLEEESRQAAENKDAIGQAIAQLSKVAHAEWWQDSASDMAGSMASFVLPGMAVGKLVRGSTIASRFLARGIGTNLAEKAVQYLVGDSIMSGSEAAMEAGTVFKDVKQNLLDKGLTEEEATKQAADAASENWGVNYMALMGTNVIQMGGFLGKLSSSTNALKRIAVNIGAPILSEGFEEAFQTNAQRYATNKGSNEPYNEGKNTGVFDSGIFNTDGAMGGTLQSVYKSLMEGDAETWESAIGGALMGGGGSLHGTYKTVRDLYKVEKPLMSQINNSLVLSPNDIYKTKEDGSLEYDAEGKPQIDPTKHFSNIKAINSINSIDALTEEAFNKNNAEAIKFLHTSKIASIAHDYLSKSEDGNIEALENAVNNSMTKKDYEKNKLSEFYSFEEFKSIRKNVLETAKDNYEKVYSDPKLKLQSAEYKQGIYHNLIQQDLVNAEIDKYTDKVESFKNKGEKLNSLEKESKKDLETKLVSLESYKSQLEASFEKFSKTKTTDAKETKAEEVKTEAAEAAKQGVPVEEILANKTGEEFKAAKEGIIEANTQAIIDELDTYNSPKQYEAAIKNNPEHAKLINDHFNNKLGKQTKAPLTNVNQIPTRYGQENNFLQEHEQQKVGKELDNLLNEKENLGEEVANYEQLKADPNFKFIPDPELIHLGNHILGGGSVATYTQNFNQDNLQDPLLQKAIDRTNNIKEVPVKEESPLPEVINEEEKKTELDLKKADIERRRQEELNTELDKKAKDIPVKREYYKDSNGNDITVTTYRAGNKTFTFTGSNNIAADNFEDLDLQSTIPYKTEEVTSKLENKINAKYDAELAALENKEAEIPYTAPEVFVPMSGLPESRGKGKTIYVTIFDSNGNEVETKVSRFVPKDIWNTSQSSKLEKLNEYFNLSEGHSYKETVIPENEEYNKGTHTASTILKEGDTVYYEITPDKFNETATKDNFIISVVSYIKNGKAVKRDTIDAERIVVSQVPSNTNSFIKDNAHKLEIKKIRELAWENFNTNRSSTFQVAEVKIKNLNRTTAYHKGNWRNITKKEIKNFIFDVVIQKWESNETGFSSSIEDPALFNSGNSLAGIGNMRIEPQDIGKVIMFVPNTNSVTGEISNVPVKLNTKKLSEVPAFKQKLVDALNNIMTLPTFDERLEATNKMWYNLVGSKVGSISRKRIEDSTFDTDSKDGLVNPRGGIGNIIYYQESKFDPTKKGFFTVINGKEFSYLSVEDLVNKLGETRVHIPHDLVKLTLERFPELVQTDLIEPQERGIDSEMPNIFMGTNVMVESLPERIDIVEQEQEQAKQEQEQQQDNSIIEEDENVIPVFKISNKSYTGTGAKNYIKERFTEIGVDISDASLEILKELYEVGDSKVWGAFYKGVVHLASDAGLKIGKHEAMHVLFNLFLNPKQKVQIYNELFKKFGKELGISKEEFEKWINKPIEQTAKFKVEDEVNYTLKAIDIIVNNLSKIQKWESDKSINKDLLWNKIQSLGISQEQINLLKESEGNTVEEKLLDFNSKYGYTIEINTAKTNRNLDDSPNAGDLFNYGNDSYTRTNGGNDFKLNGKAISEDKLPDFVKNYFEETKVQNQLLNTQHYSNLTVPGGTNYTENEIATPAITPSIKGHAQFATDNGIGWFRSDDKENKVLGWKEENDFLNSETAQYNPITKNDKIIWGHPAIGKSYAAKKVKMIDFDSYKIDINRKYNLHITKGLSDTELRTDNKTREARENWRYKSEENQALWNQFIRDAWQQAKKDAKEQGAILFASDLLVLREFGNEVDKALTMPDELFFERSKQRNNFIEGELGTKVWKSNLNKAINNFQDKYGKDKVIKTDKYLSELFEGNPKTRRILEVQSDLFQKGRDKEDLILKQKEDSLYNGIKQETTQDLYKEAKSKGKEVFAYHDYYYLYNNKYYSYSTINNKYYVSENKSKENTSENQFLQLLNKDNNWVTFFIKSIIQDSAKKGYEKVLFPSGNTASKVEGHTTLEEFKKQKEDRIKELEKQLKNPEYVVDWLDTSGYSGQNIVFKTEQEALDYVKTENAKLPEDIEGSYTSLFNGERLNREINQLKQELERVEREGFGALKPIYNFYENTVKNILKKNYTVNEITDEYGNTWNELTITEKHLDTIRLKTNQNFFYQKQNPLIRLEEKLAELFEDYKYTGVLPENFKKSYPETSSFLEKIFKFLLDQYHMLKGYLTDSLTINDIFYQLDNNIFGKGYDGKRRKSYKETFSRNLMEIYGEEAKFKLNGVDTINLRKYSKFIVTNIFTNLLPSVKDKSGVPRKVSWLTDVLKDNKDASSLVNDLFKKLPAEIDRRIANAKNDQIKKSMEEIKSILNEDRFKWEILAQVKEITGYGFTPIEENNNEDVDDDTSDEVSDPTGEHSESNVVKKNNQEDPKNNIKGKLRELLNKIVKYDIKNKLPLIDPATGGFVYYEFNEVSNRLYHYLPDSLDEKDMWNRILELSESFEDMWFIRNQIEQASKQRNQDIYDTDLFNKLWLKFGGQRKINYSFAINNNDGTVNVKNSTKHRVHDNILTEVRNYIELQNRKVNAPEVNIDNLFQLFNVYGLYISKADIAKLNEKEIVKALNAFTNFEKYISNGGNPFTFELNKTPEIVSANNLVELVVKYSPNLADNVIYTIHGKKEFIVQMNNFLTKTLNQFKNNNQEFRNKFKNTILHSKLPIYDLNKTDISKWEVHYNNGFIQQGKKKGTEYSKFTLKELVSQNINFAFSDVNSKTMKVMLPIFSDATSHAYMNVNKLSPDIIIMQMAKTAIAELERIKFSLENKTGYKNFDKNGKHFLLLPFLEKHKEELLKFDINDPLLSAHLEALIEPVIKRQFTDYTNKLIKLGVLDKIVTVTEDKVKLEKIVAGTGVTSRINESNALDRIQEYFYNQYYYNTQFIPLFAGDPAFYKPNEKNKNDTNPEMSVSKDFLKRFKEVHSPTTHGLYKDINGKPKSTKKLLYLYDVYKPSTDEFIDGIAYLNDIPSNIVDTYKKEVRNLYSETKEELTEEEKDLKKKYPNAFSYLHNFSQNNLTDAQKLNNPEFTLMVMEAHDKISPEQRKILREQINNNLATDVTLEVLKPFVFSHEFMPVSENSNLLRPFQEKNSEFSLLPNVAYLTKDKSFEVPTKDTNWDNYVFPTKAKLLWIMQGMGNPKNIIDGISFESATKVDLDLNNLMSIDDVLDLDPTHIYSKVVTSSMDGYGLSNEVPADKQLDKNIDLGSQIKVLITEGLKEPLTINGVTYNPEDLLNEFQDLHIKGHREQFNKLKNKTSTAEKTIAILKEAAIKLGKSVSTIMGYNKNVDGKPNIPLELDATSNQHMLNSLTKKTVSESGPGGTFVNVSSVSIDDLAVKWKKDKAGKVIGIDHIECAAAINSPYIDALADKNGIVTVEDVENAYGKEVADKLLSMVAYRIPTEDKYSMYPLKIKYLLPKSSGAALMLPKEATSITGLDFDVDKMFFIKYAFEIESNFSKYLGHVNDIIGNSSVQDGETISSGLVDPETGNPYVLTTDKFKELFNKALNEDIGLTIEEDAIIEHFKDNMNEYKELLDTKNIKLIPSSYDTSSSRHNFKLDIMLAIAQTTSFAKSFTHPGSSSILAKEVELFLSSKYSNYDIIEDESTAQVTLPDVQDENAKKANIGGSSIGIFANANKHHAIIEYAHLKLKKTFNFSNTKYDFIGERKSKDGKFIKDITASLLFASTEHIKTPLMDKLNIDLDNVNALLAGIRLGVPFHDLMVLINQPVIKETLKKFPNSTQLVTELNNEISGLALQNQIDLNSVQKSDITIAELETMFNPKGLTNKVVTRESLIALNKFIELATIGEELFQIQINTKFDTSNQFGPELLDNQFKLQRLEYLYDKLSDNSVFTNFDDIVPKVTYNKTNQEWTLAPSKLKLNDSYIQIMVDQLNHFKNNFSFLGDSFIKLQYLIKDLSNQNHFYPHQIKKINGEIYNAVAQGILNDIADIITNVPTEWANIRYKTKEQYMPFLNALTREIVFGKPVLRLYDNVIVGNALSDKYKDIFEDMLADPDTKVFAERLAVYAYFTSGFKFTPRGFSRFVPNTFLLENEQGKKIRDLYNNFDINKSNLKPDEIAELIIYNNPSLVTSINMKDHVDNIVTKPTSHGSTPLPSSFIIKEDMESLYVDKFGNPNRFLSYTVYIPVAGESVALEMLFESTGNIRGYYSAVNLPGNSKIFSNYTGVDLGFYPDVAPVTIELNSNEISEEVESMPVNDLDTAISYYEGNITPEPNTIFVFGSNPEGRHGAGAANVAKTQFGLKEKEQKSEKAFGLITKDLMGYGNFDKSILKVEPFGGVYYESNGATFWKDKIDYKGKRYLKIDDGTTTNGELKEGALREGTKFERASAGGKWLHKLPKEFIQVKIAELYEVARQNPSKQFKIAYKNTTEKSLNGYTGLEMIDMFSNAGRIPLNIVFSKEWIDTGKLRQVQTMPVKEVENNKNIPGYKDATNLFLGIPEYTIDKTLKNKNGSKRLANTNRDGTISLNPVKSVEEFFDYFTGKNSDNVTSKQKEKVLEVLETKGYSLNKIKSILDTTYKIHQFLLLHEQSHIDNKDIDVYFKEGGDLLTNDKIDIEVRASIDALVKLDLPDIDIDIKNEKCK